MNARDIAALITHALKNVVERSIITEYTYDYEISELSERSYVET